MPVMLHILGSTLYETAVVSAAEMNFNDWFTRDFKQFFQDGFFYLSGRMYIYRNILLKYTLNFAVRIKD